MQVTQFANIPKVGENPIKNAIFTAGNVVKPYIPPCQNLCFIDIPGLCTEPFNWCCSQFRVLKRFEICGQATSDNCVWLNYNPQRSASCCWYSIIATGLTCII